MKRKLEPSNSKDKDDKINKQKAPLKAELIVQLKELQDNFKKLEEDNSKNLETIRLLQNKIDVLEKEKCETQSKTQHQSESELVCGKCDFKASNSSELSVHLENEHGSEDCDSSQGDRVCKICEAEDMYELDGHIWSEHEEDEDGTICCNFCDEKFANISNMMIHKKIKHREKINFCQNFNSSGCPFEDKKCWFLHTRNSEIFKCNICDKTFFEKSQFMKHRKTKHPEMVKTCKNYECIYDNECWFRHDFEDIKEDNIKANENEKLIEKLVTLVEKLNERVSKLETPEKNL